MSSKKPHDSYSTNGRDGQKYAQVIFHLFFNIIKKWGFPLILGCSTRNITCWKIGKKKRHNRSLHLHLHGNSSLQQHIVHTINNLCNKLLFIESIFRHIQLESIDMLYLWLVRTWRRRDSEQCLKLPHKYCESITNIVAFQQCP